LHIQQKVATEMYVNPKPGYCSWESPQKKSRSNKAFIHFMWCTHNTSEMRLYPYWLYNTSRITQAFTMDSQ